MHIVYELLMNNENSRSSTGEGDEDQWIEMNHMHSPPRSPRSPHSPNLLRPSQTPKQIPQLRLDTSNLQPSHSHGSGSISGRSSNYDDEPPKSAILGLASNLTKSEWLPRRSSSSDHRSIDERSDSARSPRSHSSSPSGGSPSPLALRGERSPFSDANATDLPQNIPRLVLNVQRSFEPEEDVTDDDIPGSYRGLTHGDSLNKNDKKLDRDNSEIHDDFADNNDDIEDSDASSYTEEQTVRRPLTGSPQSRARSETRSDTSSGPQLLSPNRALNSPSSPGSSPGGYPRTRGHPHANRSRNQLLTPSDNHRLFSEKHLTLSGAAINAQRDLIDAEEQDDSLDDRATDQSSLAGTSLHNYPYGASSIGIGQTRSNLSQEAFPHSPGLSPVDLEFLRNADNDDDKPEQDSFLDNEINEPMGRSLFIFPSTNRFRRLVFVIAQSKWTRWIMILLTLVQIITLCIEQGPTSEFNNIPPAGPSPATMVSTIATMPTGTPNASPDKLALSTQPRFTNLYIGLYVIYTVVLISEAVAFGVFTNEALSKQDLKDRFLYGFKLLMNFVTFSAVKKPNRQHLFQDPLTVHNCVLRGSWGRVEFISIVFFWVVIGAYADGYVSSLELFVTGMSHLRIMRILDYFPYTRTVLHVIKTAIPFLQNVVVFMAFFIGIWTLIGVQSFNGSLRRVCRYGDIITSQNCGSYLNATTYAVEPYLRLITPDGLMERQETVKGYTCPAGSVCVELRSFPNGQNSADLENRSFDNFFNALEIVLIIMSYNGFTPIMYQIIDSEYLVSSLFFISGVLVLAIWLMNLLVAVMVSSYAAVKRSIENNETDIDHIETLRLWIHHKLKPKIKNSDPELNDLDSIYSDHSQDDSREPDRSIDRIDSQDHADTQERSNLREGLRNRSPDVTIGHTLYHSPRGDIYSSRSYEDEVLNKNSGSKRWYNVVHATFTQLAIVDLIVQACLTPPDKNLLPWESVLAGAFGFEIILRFISYYPDWRSFISSRTTWIDLSLAIANVITLFFYKNREAYSWLTAFQLLRIHRVVGSIRYSRVFWLQIFSNFRLLASITAFYFISTLLVSLIAEKMLRSQYHIYDDEGSVNMFSFYDLAASFFSMYQVSSTENWTDVLFWTTDNVSRSGSSVVGLTCIGILIAGWLFFANYLVLNLFIGVMSENLHGSIGNKREEQVRRFAEEVNNIEKDAGSSDAENLFSSIDIGQDSFTEGDISDKSRYVTMLDRLGGYISGISRKYTKKKSTNDIIRNAIEQKFVIEFLESNGGLGNILNAQAPQRTSTFLSLDEDRYQERYHSRYPILKAPWRRFTSALGYLHHYPPAFRIMLRERLDEYHKQATSNSGAAYVEAMFDTRAYVTGILDEYCQQNPTFDKPLFLFGSNNPIRRFFQRIFLSSHGSRRSKVYPSQWVNIFVRLFYLAATVTIVVLTCINTPLLSLDQKQRNGTWTVASLYDLTFGCIFLFEFLGKVIADGFHFTPNAYTRNMWNDVDLIVLISIWLTFINDMLNGPISRYVRALMALRALRLLSFYTGNFRVLNSALKHGLRNILGAVIIMATIVIPYSVWGKNIFRHRLSRCNDDDMDYLSECSGEFTNNVFDNFEVLSPRAVTGDYFDYDNFWNALLIQFGVLSLEGWVDVLQAVSSISESSQQSTTYSSKGNAAYPILYNYIGTVLIITMLISVIIRNFAIITGTAFLTEEQLSWLDVKRTLSMIKPTPRPPRYKQGSLRGKLLTILPTWIQSIELFTLLFITASLAAYFYPMKPSVEPIYQFIQLSCSVTLVCLSVIRLVVLKPALFCHNLWNPFGLVVCTLDVAITIAVMVAPEKKSGIDGVDRATLIAMLLLWIPKTKRLYQFFTIGTTAIAEITVLLRAWFTLFVAYAIALNQSFGLIKLGSQSTSAMNFRTIPKALIALFFMSCGEGWNEFLMDFVISKPYCIENEHHSECGISGFAYFLFISWNIISMYVFANLFISLICEGCWYVYRSGPVNINEFDIIHLLESWQEFDPKGAGLIRTRDLYKFLGRSQGYFSINIFHQDPVYSVHRILTETNADIRSVINPYDVDYEAINRYLADMPVQRYRQKRILYELFTTQAQLISDPIPGGSGIPFSKLVRMFPLYCDMDPAESLTLKEFIELKAKLYEASMIIAANFIASTWRVRRHYFYSRPASALMTPYDQVNLSPPSLPPNPFE